MKVYRLGKSCDYGDLKDEMIHDRLVVGIQDAVLSQQLQFNAKLTLEKQRRKFTRERR